MIDVEAMRAKYQKRPNNAGRMNRPAGGVDVNLLIDEIVALRNEVYELKSRCQSLESLRAVPKTTDEWPKITRKEFSHGIKC